MREKQKFRLKSIRWLLMIGILLLFLNPLPVDAATGDKTQDDVMSWMNSIRSQYEGKGRIYNHGNNQCVALYNEYIESFFGISNPASGVTYAYQIWDRDFSNAGFERINGNSDFRAGDIVVWNKGYLNSAGATNVTGHVAIVYSVDGGTVKIMEQAASGTLGVNNLWYPNYIRGVLRPRLKERPPVNPDPGCYLIYSAIGGKVLDVAGGGMNNETNIHIWTPYVCPWQVFEIGWNPSFNGYFIKDNHSGNTLASYGDVNQPTNVITYGGMSANGQNWLFEDAGNGYVYIRNLWGYYLDVNNGESADGTNVQVYHFNGSDAQKWKLARVSGNTTVDVAAGAYSVQSAIGGKVLDVSGGGMDNGANLQIWHSYPCDWQIFEIDRDGTFNMDSYYIMDLHSKNSLSTGGDTNGHENVITWGRWTEYGQHWIFEDAGDGYVYIRNLWGYYLDVNNGESADGTNVQVHTFNASNAQKWKLVPLSGNNIVMVESGYYKIQFESPEGKAFLNIEGNSTENGTNISLYQPSINESQAFYVDLYEDESGWIGYTLKNETSQKYVSSLADVPEKGTNVVLWEGDGTRGQQWIVEDAGDGYVFLRNRHGYYLDVHHGKAVNGQNVQTWVYETVSRDHMKWKLVKLTECEGKGHTVVIDEAVPATTTSTGLTEGSHCSVCGKVLKKQEIVPVLVKSGWEEVSGKKYYYINGVKVTGVQKIDGKTYYFNSKGVLQTGWLTSGTKKFYLDPTTGAMTTGLKKIEGKSYYFGSNGVMKTGWLTSGTKKYYFDPVTGAMVKGLQQIDGKTYAFGSNGVMKTGWVTDGEKKYYFNPTTGEMVTGTQKIDGKIYVFEADGVMKTGWFTSGSKKYYLDPATGAMVTGVIKIDGKTYVFSSKGTLQTGWMTKSGKTYYLNPKTGAMVTGVQKIDGKTYYFNSKGVMHTGWLTYKNKKYYFDTDGSMVTGAKTISGITYIFADDGQLITAIIQQDNSMD